MIIKLAKYIEHSYLKAILAVIKKLFLSLNQPLLLDFLSAPKNNSDYQHYPVYIIDPLSKVDLCVSCDICVDVCPVNIIKITKATSDGFDGPFDRAPKEFKIDLKSCLRCGYCISHCPEGALGADGHYSHQQLKRGNLDLKKTALSPLEGSK